MTASASENPDLFWALRGGGGNFGVVTEFTFALHPVGPVVLGGMLLYSAEHAHGLLRFWRDFMTDAPDEVGSGVAFITAPPRTSCPSPPRPAGRRDRLSATPATRPTDARCWRRCVEFGPPAVDLVEPMPYVACSS